MKNHKLIKHIVENFMMGKDEKFKVSQDEEEDVTITIEKNDSDDHETLIPKLIIHLHDSEAVFTGISQFINYDGTKQTSKELLLDGSAD